MSTRDTLLTAVVLLAVFLAGALVGAAVASTVVSTDGARAEPDGRATAGERPVRGEPGTRSDGRRSGRRGPEGKPGDGGDDGDDRRRRPDYAVARLLHEELDLDADQERRVETILERRRERAHEIFDETKSRLRSQFDSTVDELEDVLTDRQAARFDTLLNRLKERRGWGEDDHGPADREDRPSDGARR